MFHQAAYTVLPFVVQVVMKTSQDRDTVRAVLRAFDLLDAFSSDAPELTLADLAAHTGMSKSTVHRLLHTLGTMHCVSHSSDATTYRLGPRLFQLGSKYVAGLDLRRLALPYLWDLAKQSGDTSFLCVMDNDEALCIERVDGRYQVRVLALALGGRMPVHCGAAPMVLLLGRSDDEIRRIVATKGLIRFTEHTIGTVEELLEAAECARRDGYRLSWEDITVGVAAIGAPVLDYTGAVIAGISVSGILPRFSPERLPMLRQWIMDAAQRLSRDLGYTGPPSLAHEGGSTRDASLITRSMRITLEG